MAIETVQFDLSMIDPETGLYRTANAYIVEGVTNPDGSLRELSIGQLVMALSLKRAAELETQIIETMDEISNTSSQLEAMTEIEAEVLTWPEKYATQTNPYRKLDMDRVSEGNSACGGMTYRDALIACGFMKDSDGKWYVRWDGTADNNDIMYDDFITQIEAKMDEKNSFSQKTMIELQSLTNKRDQSYDMISNVLKSLNTVLVNISNNM